MIHRKSIQKIMANKGLLNKIIVAIEYPIMHHITQMPFDCNRIIMLNELKEKYSNMKNNDVVVIDLW